MSMQSTHKVLIFGSTGQDGYYLGRILERNNIEHLGISRSTQGIKGDVSEYGFVFDQIKEFKPTHIFHFAATSSTKHESIFLNYQSISTGTLNILESVRHLNPGIKVFISGSAVQFENKGLPIDENTPFDPKSAYAIARIHSVYTSRYYRNTFGLKVYIGYFFNHDSPLRTENHVNQKIIAALKRICTGSSEKLILGDINVQKEFNYAGDIIEAAWMLINQDEIFEAVIGSGEVHTIQEWVEYCFSRLNKNWQDYVLIDEIFRSEYQILISNPSLIKSIGWKPQVSFHRLADMMLSGLIGITE